MRQQAAQLFTETPILYAGAYVPEPFYAVIGKLQMENQLLKNSGAMRVAELRQVLRASSEDGVQAPGLARSSYHN